MKGKKKRTISIFIFSFIIFALSTLTTLSSAFAESGAKQWYSPDVNSLSEADWAMAFDTIGVSQPDFNVESVEEFKAITKYYDGRIRDGVEVHRFRLRNDDTVQCILIHTQGSLSATGSLPESIQFAPEVEPIDTTPRKQQVGKTDIGFLFGLDGLPDEDGNTRACPEESFPRLMPKLENLYRFQKLEDIFRKYPKEILSSTPPAPHEYANAYRWVNNIGSSAYFNIWAPYVQTSTNEFSLSQLWVTGGKRDNLQTAETGWHVFPYIYGGDTQPHLFIYYTTHNYNPSYPGCYNLLCQGFVQTNSNVILGSAISPVSTIGGNQYDIQLMYYRDAGGSHDWWFQVEGQWVGYYPNSLFNSQGIASQSNAIDYGGEIVNTDTGGLHTTTQMGSGRFPSEGWQYAAYIRQLKYFDTNNVLQDSTGLTKSTFDTNGVDNSNYYDLILSSSTDPNWLQYFYFGGPGLNPLTPNLTPYQPSGWSDKIVVTNKTGCTRSSCTDSSPLLPTDSLYVDWAVINNGGVATSATFYTQLYVDGALKQTWHYSSSLPPNHDIYINGYSIGSLSAGTHSITIITDSTNAIDESNEADNEYTKTITVVPGGPDLIGSWTMPLVQTCRNTRTGQTCTIKGTFTVINNGNRDANPTYVDFYFSEDGTQYDVSNPLKESPTGKVKAGKSKAIRFSYNFPLGQNATGKYIIAVIDKDNLVTELDKTNNIVVFGPIQ